MLPEKIRILGTTIRFRYRTTNLAESGGNTGCCNNYLNVIEVGKQLPHSRQVEIVVHEVLEVLNYRLQLELEHPKICVLGEVLAQVLIDNVLSRAGRERSADDVAAAGR